MKRKKFLIYLLSALIPTLIFAICALINGYIPFGKELLNVYDSVTQYPGMLIEYGARLKSGYLFYSFGAGLGFNFLGTITYYAGSPLNMLAVFATPSNYAFFIAGMTYLRFALLGLSMCFYLDKKGTNPVYTVLFSTIYALMGYTSAYYYNYLWIDSVIMLPFVIHGLDKILENKSPNFYTFALGFTILTNYYIGYMICIFSLVYFLFRLVSIKKKKHIVKTFIISSLLAGSLGALTIVPSYFALMTGKAELFSTVNYLGVSRNITTFFYTLLTGTYQATDQSYGPAQVYSSIIVLVLTIFYFFNTSYTKKEKIAFLVTLIFFYLSFSVNFLNYAWQFFQRPIWWQSRFSFVFSFFIITIGVETLAKIDKTDFNLSSRLIITGLFVMLALIGAYFKWQVVYKFEIYTYFYLFLNVLLLLQMMMLIDKKYFFPMLVAFTVLDLGINCYNNLKNNYQNNSYTYYTSLKEGVPKLVKKLNSENDYFYRFELTDDYTSDDGLYFGYNGINYFNSVRNIKVVNLMEKLGLKVVDKCHIYMNKLDPVFLSLFNFKYLYGEMDYFEKVGDRLYENPYPLAIGFVGDEKIKYTELTDGDYRNNLNLVVSDLLGEDFNLYQKHNYKEFTLTGRAMTNKKVTIEENAEENSASYSFTSDGHYLLMPSDLKTEISIDGELVQNKSYYLEIEKGEKVSIKYIIQGKTDLEDISLYLLNLDNYEKAMQVLSQNTLKATSDTDGHILSGEIDVTKKDAYLFTSIEYEEGMKVFVDGKEVEPDIILDALIGLKLDEGHHTIYIDYTPKGLKEGLSISLIGLAATCFYLQRVKKKL